MNFCLLGIVLAVLVPMTSYGDELPKKTMTATGRLQGTFSGTETARLESVPGAGIFLIRDSGIEVRVGLTSTQRSSDFHLTFLPGRGYALFSFDPVKKSVEENGIFLPGATYRDFSVLSIDLQTVGSVLSFDRDQTGLDHAFKWIEIEIHPLFAKDSHRFVRGILTESGEWIAVESSINSLHDASAALGGSTPSLQFDQDEFAKKEKWMTQYSTILKTREPNSDAQARLDFATRNLENHPYFKKYSYWIRPPVWIQTHQFGYRDYLAIHTHHSAAQKSQVELKTQLLQEIPKTDRQSLSITNQGVDPYQLETESFYRQVLDLQAESILSNTKYPRWMTLSWNEHQEPAAQIFFRQLAAGNYFHDQIGSTATAFPNLFRSRLWFVSPDAIDPTSKTFDTFMDDLSTIRENSQVDLSPTFFIIQGKNEAKIVFLKSASEINLSLFIDSHIVGAPEIPCVKWLSRGPKDSN